MFFELLIYAMFLITIGQNPVNHVEKLPRQPQLEKFKTVLVNFINPQHDLCLLAKKIDWGSLEKEFSPLYGEVERPSIPVKTTADYFSSNGYTTCEMKQ
jgi:hypothetical protein